MDFHASAKEKLKHFTGVRVWTGIPMKLRIKNRTPFKRELKNRLLKLMKIEEMNVDLQYAAPKFANISLLVKIKVTF